MALNSYSEKLLSDTDSIDIPGVGVIAQYHCYVDMIWSHNLPYFVRDEVIRDLRRVGETPELLARYHSINSKIQAYERANGV